MLLCLCLCMQRNRIKIINMSGSEHCTLTHTRDSVSVYTKRRRRLDIHLRELNYRKPNYFSTSAYRIEFKQKKERKSFACPPAPAPAPQHHNMENTQNIVYRAMYELEATWNISIQSLPNILLEFIFSHWWWWCTVDEQMCAHICGFAVDGIECRRQKRTKQNKTKKYSAIHSSSVDHKEQTKWQEKKNEQKIHK